MSNKAKSFLCLVSFIIVTMVYHIIDKKYEADATPQIAKVEVIHISTLVGIE